MPFFQNPFDCEFRGHWVLEDRQFVITFIVQPNKSDIMVAFNTEPYDFSVLTDFTISYAYDPEFKLYSTLVINVAGAVPAETTAAEVAAKLNADPIFADYFTTTVRTFTGALAGQAPNTLLIRSKRSNTSIRTFISNSGAESKMRFNKKAGVNDIPTYFERHTVDNRFNPLFPDSLAKLILLDPSDPIDAAIIADAGFDPTMPKADWELLSGRSGMFLFKKFTIDGSGRITRIIEYNTGATKGDLSRQIDYVYTGTLTSPDQITEIPHTLESGDLITPP